MGVTTELSGEIRGVILASGEKGENGVRRMNDDNIVIATKKARKARSP
jgi:hypothetical protein